VQYGLRVIELLVGVERACGDEKALVAGGRFDAAADDNGRRAGRRSKWHRCCCSMARLCRSRAAAPSHSNPPPPRYRQRMPLAHTLLKPPKNQLARNFFLKNTPNRFLVGSDSSDSDDARRVVRSARDRAADQLRATCEEIRVSAVLFLCC
jgi:hypothetical protein